jgi:carboxyl-terminal processing protease
MLTVARWTIVSLLAVSILVLAFALGYVINDGGSEASTPQTSSEDPEGSFDFETLNQIEDLLGDKYVDPDRIDTQTLYESAISGMLDTLTDSGTFYVDPNTVATSIGPSGTFDGIGATVAEQNGEIIIVAPIEDTPAERAGLTSGDVIVEVDGESTEGWSTEKAVIEIRGPRGTTVTLLVRHNDGSEETLEIERDEIQVDSVTTLPPGGTLQDGAGNDITDLAYIYIREFSDTTDEEIRAALEEAVDSGKAGVILDVRDNPGGLLSTTIAVADEFLDDGVILSERERDGTETSQQARDGGAATDIPVVILQNRFSASGAEVLAAALQDNGRATIVGEKSFGKGTVNVKNDLADGGQLYVSVARWLTPDGTLIDGVGIRPDIEVLLSDEDIDLRRDVQLMKAIDVLRGTNVAPVSSVTPTAEETPAAQATPTPGG